MQPLLGKVDSVHLNNVQEVALEVLWKRYPKGAATSDVSGTMVEAYEITKALERKYPKRFHGAYHTAQQRGDFPDVKFIELSLFELVTRKLVHLQIPEEVVDPLRTISQQRPLAFWQLFLTVPQGVDVCAELFAPWWQKAWRWVGHDVRTIAVAVITAFITALVAYYLLPLLGIGSR